MERRSSERFTAGYRTEIIFGNNSFPGVIENISWSGANVLTDLLAPETEFLPDELIDLKFESPAGETVILKCQILWSSKIPPGNERNRIGLQLLERPWDKIAFFF